MNAFGSYLLQMGCWLAGFWLIYVLVLRKETFFNLNRWFLLSGLVLSLLMPMFPLRYAVEVAAPEVEFQALSEVPIAEIAAPQTGFVVWKVVYGLGILFFLARSVGQYVKLLRVRKRGEKVVLGNMLLFKLKSDTAPFSFFSKVYVSSKMCNDTELKTVLAHEKVHIDERHWIDLMVLELVRTVQWFNPLLILYQKAVKENHEYLADRGALQSGVSAHTYKALLANRMLGVPVLLIANGFTLFNPTKRIFMMNKNKTMPVKRLKLLWALPVFALILTAFARPEYVPAQNTENGAHSNEALLQVKGKVFDQFGKPVADALIYSKNEQIRSLSDEDGCFVLEGVSGLSDVALSKEGYNEVNRIVTGENELVILTMKNKSVNNKTISIKGKVITEKGEPLPGASVILAGSNQGTVSGVDGTFSLDGIKPDDRIVFSFVGYQTVKVKAQKNLEVQMKRAVLAVEVVGSGNRPGDVTPPPPPPPPPYFELKGNDGKKPLVILDGKAFEGDINSIDPNTIERVEVLKSQSATAEYGKKGENGVVLITIKKQPSSSDGEVFVVVEELPSFKGGPAALQAYLEKATAGSREKGTVQVQFTVEADGSINKIKVIDSSSKALGDKATSIMQSMPAWIPGTQRGKSVAVDYSMKIEFK